MLVANVVTTICLIVLSLELLGVVINVVAKKRSDRISFLRSFKKGKCAIIYITAIPLYCVGHMYAGQDFLKAFFGAVNKIINLVVLKYDTGSVDALMADSPLFYFTIYMCFAMVGMNALLLTISLTNQHIWEFLQGIKAFVTRKDKVFIFGNTKDNISIYKSNKKFHKTIVDNISDKDCEKLYLSKISYISTPSFQNTVLKLFKVIKKRDRQYIVIINTGDDNTNMLISRLFIDEIRNTKKEDQDKLFLELKIFVFGDPRYEAIYEDIVSSGYGCIHYVNKYQKIAMDFIDKYPLTKFMSEKQIDYSTSLVRKGVDINVFFIGFGKTNQQIFLTSVANNQFLTEGERDPDLKAVKYFIFDKDEAENNKNLNHNYYRYRNECADLNPTEYLPLPSLPAEENYQRLDVNDCDFYNQIRRVVTRNPNDANFIIIAFGSDLENIDMAQKLVEKREEWNLEKLTIFVKVRVWHKEQTLLEEDGCYFIGNEKDAVYNLDKILGDKIFLMAKLRNEIYDLEYDITHNSDIVVDEEYIKNNRYNANRNWHIKKSQMERESSLYCCLSLRSKLNLMGLDYCERSANSETALTQEEYIALYAGDDKPMIGKYEFTADGKEIVSYTLDFPTSRRRNMAIHEHQRWNSFMISKGMIPSSIEQIRNEVVINADGKRKNTNGKNYAVRRHGNLTTFDGLVAFRQIVAGRDRTPESEADVIKYDYQLLDDAFWLLETTGYKIIKNTPWD